MLGLDSGDNSDDGILTDGRYSTNNSNNLYRFDHLHESQSSVEEGKSANSDDRNLTDADNSTNISNNPYQFDHLHESQSSVEEGKSAEDLENKAVTDVVRIKTDFDIPARVLKTRKVFTLEAKIISSQFYQNKVFGLSQFIRPGLYQTKSTRHNVRLHLTLALVCT
jgi:hypothetical protein